ncbi:unnamed protein product [Symbiodinium microadriaticum]|nr:unnamed protein product [Symbiodinium microadriaticum]
MADGWPRRPVSVEQVVEKDLSTTLLRMTLPVRHRLRCWRLQPLNLVFRKKAWDVAEFNQQTTEVFRRLADLGRSGDVDSLKHELPEDLLEAFRRDSEVAAEVWASRRLLEVEPLGIFTTKLWPDPNNHLSLFVTQTFRATEEYADRSTTQRYQVERLHRWTFKRVLQNDYTEEVGDWMLVDVNKGCWMR